MMTTNRSKNVKRVSSDVEIPLLTFFFIVYTFRVKKFIVEVRAEDVNKAKEIVLSAFEHLGEVDCFYADKAGTLIQKDKIYTRSLKSEFNP